MKLVSPIAYVSLDATKRQFKKYIKKKLEWQIKINKEVLNFIRSSLENQFFFQLTNAKTNVPMSKNIATSRRDCFGKAKMYQRKSVSISLAVQQNDRFSKLGTEIYSIDN